jgi:diacylglycerol diphosphate phosphatase/phosphatidate phosphatase
MPVVSRSSATGLYGLPVPTHTPSPRQWWRATYLIDYAFAILLAVSAGIPYWTRDPPHQWFWKDDPNLSWPETEESHNPFIRSVHLSTYVPFPILVLFLQIWFRSWHDAHHFVLGWLQMFALQTFTYCFLWLTVGEPRPNFFESCHPIADGVCAIPWGNDDLVNARKSFPSGHAGYPFAAAVFSGLYLWGKFKPFRNHGLFIVLAIPYAGAVLAFLIGGNRVRRGIHNGWDVIAGIVLSGLIAVGCYHLQYPPLWDPYSGLPRLRTWRLRQSIKWERCRLPTLTFDTPTVEDMLGKQDPGHVPNGAGNTAAPHV